VPSRGSYGRGRQWGGRCLQRGIHQKTFCWWYVQKCSFSPKTTTYGHYIFYQKCPITYSTKILFGRLVGRGRSGAYKTQYWNSFLTNNIQFNLTKSHQNKTATHVSSWSTIIIVPDILLIQLTYQQRKDSCTVNVAMIQNIPVTKLAKILSGKQYLA